MSDQLRTNLQYHEDASTSYVFVAATDWSGAGVSTRIPAKAGFTLYVNSILLSVTTDNAATQQWRDSAGTPVPIAMSKASPDLGPILWDFGANGLALTPGTGLQHLMSGAGMAGAVAIVAHYRRTPNS